MSPLGEEGCGQQGCPYCGGRGGPVLVVDATAIPLGEPREGQWCDGCLLPALTTAVFMIVLDDTPLGLKVAGFCDSGCPEEAWVARA